MTCSNILLGDIDKYDVVSTKKAFSAIGVQSTLHFAENDDEAWSMLQEDHKIAPTPKIIFIDIKKDGINGMDLLH